MRHIWVDEGNTADAFGLYFKRMDGLWIYMGWVERSAAERWRVLCSWMDKQDYPEGRLFDTSKQARRALKAAAIAAYIGGLAPRARFTLTEIKQGGEIL